MTGSLLVMAPPFSVSVFQYSDFIALSWLLFYSSDIKLIVDNISWLKRKKSFVRLLEYKKARSQSFGTGES